MKIGGPSPYAHQAPTHSSADHKEAFQTDYDSSERSTIQESMTGTPGSTGPTESFQNFSTNTSSWFTPKLTYVAGQPKDKGVQNILNRPEQPIPLKSGELVLFADTQFKPECCPNTYSTGSGCACMTVGQYNYLIDRGGNNVPYSEY